MAYNKDKSVKTRIQMYKSYKNLKNGKIRLGRRQSEITSQDQSDISQSRKLSEGTFSHRVSQGSSRLAKNKIGRTKTKLGADEYKSKSFVSKDENYDEYNTGFEETSREVTHV